MDSHVSGVKPISSHHSGLAWEQNAAGEFGVVRTGIGEGKREGIFCASSGSDDVGILAFAPYGIGKGKLKPKRRRNWLHGLKGVRPRVASSPRVSCLQFRLLSIEESEI